MICGVRHPTRTANKKLKVDLSVPYQSSWQFYEDFNADLCAEVFNELHSSHQVTGLEQGLKLGVELMMEGNEALSKGSQLFLGKQDTKEMWVLDNWYQ